MLLTMPRLTASRAKSGGVQWLMGSPLSLGVSQANAIRSVTCSGVNVVGPPGRCRSDNTSRTNRSRSLSDAPCFSAAARRPCASAHRLRQRRTRCRSTRNRLACSKLAIPSADITTIRARSARPRGVQRARSIFSRIARCRSDTATTVAFLGKTRDPH